MSLHFRYKLVSVPHAVWSLGGRYVRPRPLVEVTVIGPADTRVRLAHVDQGSDDTVFSETLAAQIGLDLTNAPQGTGSVVGGPKIALRYAEVTLRITDGREQREWPARVGFTAVPLAYPLRDVLDHFDVIISRRRQPVWLLAGNYQYQVVGG